MKSYSIFGRISIVLFFLFGISPLLAQVNIIDPNAANSPDINKCSGSAALEVVVQFGADGTNATVSLPIATGFQYVVGSVALVSQTGGLTITQTSSAPNNPVFTIAATDGVINYANEIRFRYRVRANCSVALGTVVFPVNVTFNSVLTSNEVVADVLEADLNLTTHPQTSATIGVPVTVPILIQNGGLGEIDSLDFFITESGMTTTNVVVNAIPSTLISNVAGVRQYRIYSNALPGGKLNNPETITVLRTVVVQSCTFTSNYAANWGCNGSLCQTPQPFGPGEFILTSGSPNVAISTNVVQSTNLCTNAIVELTFLNNGTGPANAAAAFNMVFKAGMNSTTGWSAANWSAVSVTMVGNPNPVSFTGGSSGTSITLNANQFTTDPDGANGLADADLDGRFDDLPQGKSVTLRITLQYTCPLACPALNETANLLPSAMYSDQCGAMLNATGPAGFAFANTAIGTPALYVPKTVTDAQVFNAEICFARSIGGPGVNCPTNKIRYQLTLPAGVTATGVATINGLPATVTTTGSTVMIEGPFINGQGMCLSIQMSYACNTTPLNFSYEVSYQCDVACACIQKWACGTFNIEPTGCIGASACVGCPECPDGGITIGALQVQRTTLGYTDHTGTTRVTNPSTLPALSLLKAMPCDTMRFTMSSIMKGGDLGTATFDNAYMEVSYAQLGGSNLLGYGSGSYRYFDASTGTTTTGTLPAPSNSVASGRHIMVWNFNTILPGGMMQLGDSIIAIPHFVVLNNAALTVTPTSPGGAFAAFFNLASSAGNPLPGGSPRFTCGSFVPQLYLHAIKPQPLPVTGARMGCGTYPVSGALNNEVTLLVDEYPNEIRPVEILKSVSVQIQNGDTYDPSVQPVLTIFGNPTDDPWYTGTFNLPAPSISGTTLTWTNPGNWPVSDMAGTDPAQTGYSLRFNLKNSGCANANDGTLRTTWNYDRFGYAVPACRLNVITSPLTGTVEGGAPQHTLSNLTGFVYGAKAIECFQVEIKNTTLTRESGYIWLALEDNLSSMDVVSVRNVATNTVLPLLSYSNGKWIKLATNFPGGSSLLLEVCVRYNNCTDNLMTLKQGWDCNAYPTNPTTYACPVTQTTLRILPFMARVQGDFLAASLPAMMCEDFIFNFRINSSQKADLFDPAVNVVLPPNMQLQGNTVEIEYPLNSGIWQTVTPVIAGQMISVDFTAHTGINDTLPGTIHANVIGFPGGEDRQAQVRFRVRTNCDYLSGDRISFQPMGNAACGGTADGSGVTFLSPRVRIFGAEPTYEGTFAINLGSPDNLFGCYAQKLSVTLQLADVNVVDNLNAFTGTADTVFLTIPSILDVVPGSFTCTTLPAGNCPTFIDQTIGAGGRRIIRLKLPANMTIPNASVVPLVFNMLVQPQQEVACTVNDNITGRIIAVYDNIACPNPPGGGAPTVCPKVRALAGEGQISVVIKKMELAVENFSIACSLNGQIQYTAKVRILNLPLAADSSIVVEIYCLDALGMPLFLVETKTITGPRAVGSLVTLTGSFAGCDPQSGVLLKIPLYTSTGAFQCHCAPISMVSNNLPKCPSVVVTTTDSEICPYENANVTATLSGATSGGTWTSSGTGTFSPNNTALNAMYIPSTADKAAGVVTLTFTTNDLTGTCAPGVSSVLITIRPLPVVAPATLFVCATVSGGNAGSFNLTLADNLVDPQDVNVVTYHTSQANANTGASPLSSPYTANNNTTLYARVKDATTGCFNTTTLLLKVNPWPTANQASLSVCEEVPVGSGFGLFNLALANSQVNSGSGIAITYHATLADAQNDINALNSPHTAYNGNVVFARVEIIATGCYATSQVTLNVLPSPITYTHTLKVCAMGAGMIMSEFTLTQANNWVTTNTAVGPVPPNLVVTYHNSYSDAANDLNPLASPYTSVTANVWVRVENSVTGCYAIDIVQLVVLPLPIVLVNKTDESCVAGQGNTNNGSAVAVVTSGQINFTYDWSNNGPQTPDTDLAMINGLGSGTYTVTITDGNGCTTTGTVVINEATAVAGSASVVSNALCRGESNGIATVVPAGGFAPYTYDWSNNGAQTIDTDPATMSGLAAGTYTVTVTDANGCTTTSQATIAQPALVLTATMASVNPTCTSGIAGAATVTVTGGTPAYTYNWNGNSTPTGDGTNAITDLSAGSYLVVVTDANGCTAIAVADLDDPTGIDASINNKTDVTCNGQNNGTASVTVIGAGPVTYDWTGSPSGDGTSTVTGLAPGNYMVTVTQTATGCTAVAFVMIMQPQPLTAVGSGVHPLCNGTSTGSASVQGVGGVLPYTYNWNGTPTGDGTSMITGLSAGTYTVTITDANLCQTVTTIVLTNPATLTSSVTNIVNVACFGGTTGSATAVPAGGTAPYTYDWSNDGPEMIDNDAATVTGLVAGTYTVTITDANGCVTSTSVMISQAASAVTATITGTTNATCSVSSGSATVVAAGGTSSYTYDWSNDGFENPDNDLAAISGLAPGAYIVIVTDNVGCTALAVANVANPAGLSASITAKTDPVCIPGTNGSATVTAVGGTGPFDFDWSHTPASPDVTNQVATTHTLSNLAAGNYTITITDANNCTAIAFVMLMATDNVAPVIVSCPINIVNLTCGQAVPAPFTTTAAFESAGGAVSDNCTLDANLMISASDYDNNLGLCNTDGVHSITRTYTFLDQFNNKATCTQTLSYIDDITPPVIGTPAVNLACINGCINGAIPPQVQNWLAIHGGATATDACSSVTWTNNYNAVAAQALCNDGATLSVVFTATDACGNSVQTTATICINTSAVIGVAKRMVQTVLNADGSANVTFEFNLENFGNVNLNALTLTDNLAVTFPANCAVTVMNLTSDDFIINPGFTGTGNNNMLAAGNDLPVGDKGAVLLTVNVANCGSSQTSFSNTATATGTSPGGTTVTDVSVNGSDPDGTDNDNNPDESSTTPVSFTQNPVLGIAKRMVQTVLNADGSANVTFEFNLENFGNVNLNALTLTDDLAATFPASCAVTVMNLTSDDFIINPGFTGTGNNNMLAAGNDLPVGDKGAVLLTVNVANCGSSQTSFSNTATATGTSPGGTTVTDMSVNGSDPDGTDGDNNPDESSTTPVSFTQNPVLGVAKRNVKTVLNADGSADVTFEFNLENFGNVNLNALTLTDDLAATFPASCAVTVMNLTSDDFIINPSFNGTGNNNMLAAGNDLPVGDKGAVLLRVNVANCGSSQTSFSNTATATGTSPGGTTVTDVSVNGSDPDGTDNDNNPDESSTTPVSFTQNPVLGVAKRNVKTVLNADGSAAVTFEFNLENFGNVNLNALTLTDDLAATFPASCAVTVMNLTSDDFIINPGFTGTGNNNMLAAGNDLPVGDKGAVLLTVNVANCGSGQTSFSNTATATGTSPGGTTVTDMSVNGSDPDGTDGDNNPDESSTTPVSFTQNPVLGVAKRNVKTVLNADGSADVTFEFNLENFGNVNLNALTLTDDLAATFPASCAVTVMNLTSDDFIVNPSFNGTGNNNMLAAGNDLPVGDKGAVLLTVNVANCGSSQTSFSNTATATGTSPSGTTVTDMSVNGSDPDGMDNDNNPDESSTTPVSFTQNPVLGVAKRNVKTVLNADGSADVTFEFNLENFGNVNLNALTLTDDLAATFPASCAVTVMNLTSDDFIINPSFNGTGNNNMLAAGNDLPVGDKGAVLLTVNVANCGSAQTSFSNTATATGTSPGGTTVTDMSVNGSDPDGTDNDNNPDESSTTPVSFTQNPVLGVAKRNVKTVLNADGSANVTFEFNLENFGNVNLNALTLTDDLAATFPASCAVTVMNLTSDDFIINPGFTGTGNNNMLAAGNDLPVGDKGAVLLTVNVANCGSAQTSFSNTATATGTSPGGTTVTDVSVNGSDPDGTDGDNNPDESSTTPISFTQNPVLGIAKRMVQTVLNADGSANVTFEFNVENFGNVNLNALTLTDNLAATFPASCAVTVMNLTSDDFIINPGFTGTGNNNMLAAGNDLPVGDKGAVLLTVNVANCGSAQTSFSNTATATGTSPGGTTVTDVSVNGSDPDGTDGDNNPDESSTTPISFTQNPVLGIAKRMVQTVLNADGSANVTFEFNVENFGNVNLNALTLTDDLAATFPASCAVTVMNLTSDDFIINPGFTGTGNNNMLAAGNDLPVGDKGAVLLRVNVANCGSSQTSFSNTATATGTSPGGTTVTDVSVNGSDPDGTDNDNNPDESSTTPISFTQNPVLGVAKRNVQTVLNADGSANVTFEFNLENFGNVNLNALTLTDNLAATFPASCAVTVMNLTSDDFIINPSFNGTGNNNMLAAGNDLPVGDKGAVLLMVNVANCGSAQTSFSNTATATGTSPGGTTVTDVSVNGSDPDGTDGDNNPDEESTTPIIFIQNPVVGVAKRTVQVQTQPNGSVNVTLEFNIENLGNVTISNLAVVDDLVAAFPSTCVTSVVSLTSDDYIVNGSYNGIGNNNLLAAGNFINVADKGAILLTVNLLNCGAATSFTNTATVTGTSPGNTTVTDVSDNGSDPDPNGNGNPSDPGENDPTPVNINCILPQTYAITLKTCALGQGMLMGDFDFDALNAAELVATNSFSGTVPNGLIVTFHNSLEDANTDQNPLANIYNSQTANIWARIERSNNAACYSIEVIQLIVNPLPILLMSKTDETCSVSNDGTVGVFVTNTQGNYNYNWSNLPATSDPANQTGLNGGTYTVTVTDGNGCSSTGSVTVVEGAVLTLAPIANIGPLCPGQPTIQPTALTSTPTNAATVYTWSGGAGAGMPNGTATGLNPIIPGFNATTTEGVYTVTVTATLGTLPNQCVSTRTFTITINDAVPPVFNNCPTTMVMIGNDPDQCSGKLNWSIPTATDECATFVSITQTGGPASGSVVPITCPPTPQTITYTANDGNGNISTCTFQVMVIDTEKPEFDADILMPGNVTVECDAVPTNCIPRTGGACTPLTTADVNDNCTAPSALTVAYNQVSTQDPNPANCGHYNYTLTRTWTISDCADNALIAGGFAPTHQLVHVQVITVRDTKAPTAICKVATATLDKNGKFILDPLSVDNGSFDNCAAFPFLRFEVTPGNNPPFTCANLGANVVTLKVTDPCGNFATCTATVTVVEGIAPCTPQYNVVTMCLDNATNENNGQFQDMITIKSLAMQTWTVTANSTQNGLGFYTSTSSNPLASPVLMPLGTAFAAGTADGVDNDNDGTTDEADEMIYYTLRGRFTECVGYNISVSNATGIGMAPAASTGTIANKACYPNPYFLNLLDPFCLNTPPFTIEVGEYNNAAGSIVPGSVMVNGVVTTIFDAAALGIGFHTIMATFDAGSATNTLTINGVLQPGSGTMADAVADPGCKQKITKVVQILDTPSQLVCDDLVILSLDETCMHTLTADDVLEGSYFCYDDYLVELDKTLPYGNGPWVVAKLTAADIGKTYYYHVVHADGGNICWGTVKIEDKLAPALTCPANITLACSQSIGVAVTGNVGISDCSTTTTVIDDVVIDNGECGIPRQIIVRTFIVTDASGNQATCSQTITVNPFVLTDVIFPADITINCESAYGNPSVTQPANTGRPSINGAPIGIGGLCAASIGYTDELLEICTGSYEILRTWKISSLCLPLGSNNPIVKIQRVRVRDIGGPAFACPAAVTVSTDPFNCCATAALPDMIVSEGCSNITSLQAKVTGTNPANGNIITFTVPGSLADFAGNNWWNPDTLAVFPYTQCLPLGVYTVSYSATDGCGNTSVCQFAMTVADLIPPVPVADQVTTIGLGGDDIFDCYLPSADGCQFAGVAFLKASNLNSGSTDNCGPVKFKVRRMANDDGTYGACVDGLNNNSGTAPCTASGQPTEKDKAIGEDYDLIPGADSIKVYCCESGDTVRVIFTVYQVDINGLPTFNDDGTIVSNEVMVQVIVQDKTKPTCEPVPHVTVSCEQFDETLAHYGLPTIYDNCCLETPNPLPSGQLGVPSQCGLTVQNNKTNFDTVCNKGTIVRTFRAYDCNGFSSQCTQRIVVTYEQDYLVKFPNDVIVTACDGTGVYGTPTFFGEDCELLGVSYEDLIFTVVDDACFKIERTWTVINWCTYNPNLPCIYVPNPTPSNTTNAAINLAGPTVSPLGTPAPWAPTNVKINASDPLPTNYSTFYDANANCYEYKQIIKIIDTQDPTGIPTSPECDITPNDGNFWNADNWWDGVIASHDLCEGPANLCITATDACSFANVNIEYQLKLDTDGDGVMETIISSTNLPGFNRIYVGNNDGDLDLTDGTARAFDGRSVPANQKYGFVIYETVTGTSKTACVRWNNQQNMSQANPAASSFVIPELPYGTHLIKWTISDGCGNDAVYEQTFTIEDCKAPTATCWDLNTNIMVGGMTQVIWANDFIQYAEDNCTPPSLLKYSIRRSGTGTGFPTNPDGTPVTTIQFTCDEVGPVAVEIWVIDLAGNADYCEATMLVQDNAGICVPNGTVSVAGILATEMNDGLEEAGVEFAGNAAIGGSVSLFDLTDVTGAFQFLGALPLGGNYTVTPIEDENYLNGVTTYDLVLMSKHILGIEPLTSPYKQIAADANKSGSITTFDIVELRRLILGIHLDLPNNTSWRFVDKTFVFPNVGNPFQTPFPETVSVANAQVSAWTTDFVAVKIGDVNNSVQANALMVADDRNNGTLLFDVDDQNVKAGNTYSVKFGAAEQVKGYQFTLKYAGLEVVEVTSLTDGMTAANFGRFAEALTTSFNGDAKAEFEVKFRAIKSGKLSQMLNVSSSITRAEAYGQGGRQDVALRFNGANGSTVSGVGFELYQNVPNPFVNKTQIGFNLPVAAEATLRIFDETGRVVFEQSGSFAKGTNVIILDKPLVDTRGVLVYTLETSTDRATRKMIKAD